MRKLIISEFLTVDGVMQSPGYPDEDPSGGFESGGWIQPYAGEEVLGGEISGALDDTGALLLGRVTYEIFAAYWPNTSADEFLSQVMNGLPKHVVSRSLREPLAWQNSTLIGDDLQQEVMRLKEGSGKDIRVIGSGQLARSLMKLELVDEYRLLVFPVLLGKGKRLFPEGKPKTTLRLVGSKVTPGGVLVLDYAPARS